MSRAFGRAAWVIAFASMCTALPLGPAAGFIPGIKIAVVQSNGKVEFEFYRLDEMGRPLEERARVHNLAVYIPGNTPYIPGSTRTLWRITTGQQSKMVTQIIYGAVPDGFVQEKPSEGPAPTLEPGKIYSVSAAGEGGGFGSFVYQGQ